MKIIGRLLAEYLEKQKMSKELLACEMGTEVAEVEKLLSGEAVELMTAKAFIDYFTADEAQALIDWAALEKVNPLACEADELLKESKDENEDD